MSTGPSKVASFGSHVIGKQSVTTRLLKTKNVISERVTTNEISTSSITTNSVTSNNLTAANITASSIETSGAITANSVETSSLNLLGTSITPKTSLFYSSASDNIDVSIFTGVSGFSLSSNPFTLALEIHDDYTFINMELETDWAAGSNQMVINFQLIMEPIPFQFRKLVSTSPYFLLPYVTFSPTVGYVRPIVTVNSTKSLTLSVSFENSGMGTMTLRGMFSTQRE